MRKKIMILVSMVLMFAGLSFADNEISRPKEKYEGQGLAEPFKDPLEKSASEESAVAQGQEAPKESEKALPTLKVSGIIIGKVVNQAIVNDKILKVGDSIEEVTITNIDKGGITVLFNKKSYNISSPAANIMQVKPTDSEGGQK